MIIKNVVGLRNRVRKKLHVIMTEYEVHIMFLEKKSRYDGARGVLSTAISDLVSNIEM